MKQMYDKLALEVTETRGGTVNKPRFTVTVAVDGVKMAEATADSIKHAKQAACKTALEALE